MFIIIKVNLSYLRCRQYTIICVKKSVLKYINKVKEKINKKELVTNK